MLVKLGPADLREGELRPYAVGGRFVLVTKLDDQLHAIDDMCNHAGCLLSSGWMDGTEVVCPCHEYSFDVRTGQNTTVPNLCGDQTVFASKVENGEIMVELTEERE